MPAALIQVTRPGREDVFFSSGALPSSPWRHVHRRSSNFASETLRMSWRTEPAFGNTCTLAIDPLGDLLCGVVLQVRVRKLAGDLTASYFPIEALLKRATLLVDGCVVDTHTSDFVRIYNTMHRPLDSSEKYKRLANFDPEVISGGDPATDTFMIPLTFSFCRQLGCALPLVAMPFSEIVLQFDLAEASAVGLDASVLEIMPYGEYAYVDHPERTWLRYSLKEVLVEQVQTKTFTLPANVPSTTDATTYHAKFMLYRPVKCLYFFLRNEFDDTHGRYVGDPSSTPLALTADVSSPSGLCMVAPVSDGLAPILDAQLLFDDIERTPQMPFVWFNRLLPMERCVGQAVPGVGVFPFGQQVESLDLSGSCNFSMLREVRLNLTIKRNASLAEQNTETAARDIGALRSLVVMAWGFNVLKIQAGKGTLAFI